MSDSSESPPRRRVPRQEAQPRTWNELTEEQQQVVRDIHEWVLSFLDQQLEAREDEPRTPFEWTIDPERRSNVILIDGGRGSGKTSVMISVLRLWNELLGRNRKWVKDWKPLEEILGRLRGRIITVPILDLEPLPASTSLLPWIAGRVLKLGEAIEAHALREGRTRRRRGGKWAPEYEQEPEWKKAWRELLQDAAAGWTERVAHPRGALDAEAFATELEEENLARLSLLEHWRRFITKVLDSATTHFGTLLEDNVRLVISIDDADMNPLRCAELLKLLRMLWHPRVIFMLTGHSDLFHKTLHLQLRGVFRQLHHGLRVSDSEGTWAEEMHPTAETLAFQMYDKAIPPPQRFALPILGFEQRLKLVGDVLEIPLQQKSGSGFPGTLREYFELNPDVLPALPARLRKVKDFQQTALDLEKDGAGAIVHALWLDALRDESSQLQSEQISSVEAMVGFVEGKLQLRGLDHVFQRRTRRSKHFQFQAESNLLRFSEAAGLEYVIQIGDQGTRTLPERLNATLLLAADLASEERDGQFDALLLMPRGMVNNLVQNDLVFLDRQSAALPAALSRGPPSTTWLLPEWKLALDFAIFDTHWNAALRTWKAPEKRPAFMAAAFLEGVLAVWQRSKERIVSSHAEAPEWAVIARTLLDAAATLEGKAQRTEHDEIFLEWSMSRALLLAAPESGLPVVDANRLLSEWLTALKAHPPELQQRMLAAVHATRRVQARRLNTRGQPEEDFLENVDAHFPLHQWGIQIEKRRSSGKSLLKMLEEDLSRFDVRHRRSDVLREPGSLQGYVERLGLHIQGTVALAEEIKKKLKNLRRVSGSNPHVLTRIWQSLVEYQAIQSSPLAQGIQLSETGDSIIVQLPKSLEEGLTRFRSERVEPRVRRPLPRSGSEFILYSLQVPPPPDGLEQFLMLAHDVRQDELDPPVPWLQGKPDETWFASTRHAGVSSRFNGKEVAFGWPTPRWLAFIDWKQEEDQFAVVVSQALEVLASDFSPVHAQRILEAFAQAVLDFSSDVSDRRNQDATLQPIQDFEMWMRHGESARRVWDPVSPSPGSSETPKQGNRWDVFKAWARLAVPLYAAPELGLAPRYALGLLGGWTRQLGWRETERTSLQGYTGPVAEDIRRLRRGWTRKALREAGLSGSEEEVTRFLRQIDLANPQHPWHQVFGPDSGNEEG